MLAPNESLTVVTVRNASNNPLVFDKSNPLWVAMNNQRFRVTAEICYCSTLAECRDPARRRVTAGTTNETSRCRSPWDITFQQESAQRRSRRALFEHLARRCCLASLPLSSGSSFQRL